MRAALDDPKGPSLCFGSTRFSVRISSSRLEIDGLIGPGTGLTGGCVPTQLLGESVPSNFLELNLRALSFTRIGVFM